MSKLIAGSDIRIENLQSPELNPLRRKLTGYQDTPRDTAILFISRTKKVGLIHAKRMYDECIDEVSEQLKVPREIVIQRMNLLGS